MLTEAELSAAIVKFHGLDPCGWETGELRAIADYAYARGAWDVPNWMRVFKIEHGEFPVPAQIEVYLENVLDIPRPDALTSRGIARPTDA